MGKRSLLRFLRSRGPSSRPSPRVPDDVVLYAVGDIHGHLELLQRLLRKIESDARGHEGQRRILVFVGDYVDRGPDSRGVIEYVAAGIPLFETVCLKGNHEEVLLD